ncbi:hypothetical protein B0H10DRAFT_2016161 [Mycena sp. CBHHK59/15]|nr:hypothetical protein B0H10DRAFT_2016161 [Mycena sp. CBHHK59/15]
MPDPDFISVPTLPISVEPPLPRSQQLTLKRIASASFDVQDEISRKRMKEEHEAVPELDDRVEGAVAAASDSKLAEELAQELQCGCCSELVYRPVIVAPCQHFFCGSPNGGTNCPACRGLSTTVTPFRTLQSVLDALLRAAPHKARTERERQQADEIYTGTSMRVPPTIVDPNVDPDHAWLVEDGTPPGHALCGNCENLLALPSPLTTRCDFCQVSFCGIGVQGRCIASPILSQQPHGLSDVGDLIQSSAVYECFNSNTVEVEIMLDYLTAQRVTPRHIYREIVTHIQAQPGAFLPLVQQELFVDIHSLPAGTDPDPEAPRSRICRQCAAEVFLYGIRDWFLRERQKGFLEEAVLNRKGCVDGAECNRQRDLDNHMIPSAPEAQPQPNALSTPPAHESSSTPRSFDILMEAADSASAEAEKEDAAEAVSLVVSIAFGDGLAANVPVIHDTDPNGAPQSMRS